MSLFQKQPIYCPACGKAHEGHPEQPACSRECMAELRWRETLYIVGKAYYPRSPDKSE